MGYGAGFSVTNDRPSSVRLFVKNVNCMYDKGDQGSRLASLFNNAVVQPSHSLPDSGSQYIEEDGSGWCAFDTSAFDLEIHEEYDGSSDLIGTATIKEARGKYWQDSNTNDDVIQVMINNSSPQAHIEVTISNAGGAESTDL
jgi:hypothetical protein